MNGYLKLAVVFGYLIGFINLCFALFILCVSNLTSMAIVSVLVNLPVATFGFYTATDILLKHYRDNPYDPD